jgi:hypothetical protein
VALSQRPAGALAGQRPAVAAPEARLLASTRPECRRCVLLLANA